MQGRRRLEFTVREWEDVAYEMDLTKVGGRFPDWAMLERGAKKLGIANIHVFRKWLIIWMANGKKTAELPIIRSKYDKQRDSGEVEGVRALPTLKRRR